MTNRDLIESYYRLHRDELLAFVSSRLGAGRHFLAEDMVQEVFLRLLGNERLVVSQETLPSLVFTMAANRVADHYRHLYYQRLHADCMRASAQADYSIEPAVYAHETIARIERRLSRLPQPCAEVYRLHLYGGMKVSEISRRLGQNYKAVEYRLGQARREVRQLLSASV
ncbi:MAG: sigma-70 family RNA polymerase sigma factor [Prevotella sp.]|nr:sigma-70 family RNA polymerase sigma factor [Prevotella sp.]